MLVPQCCSQQMVATVNNALSVGLAELVEVDGRCGKLLLFQNTRPAVAIAEGTFTGSNPVGVYLQEKSNHSHFIALPYLQEKGIDSHFITLPYLQEKGNHSHFITLPYLQEKGIDSHFITLPYLQEKGANPGPLVQRPTGYILGNNEIMLGALQSQHSPESVM
ncbi:UNVERIFIED_CONTAM: hypothetical protein FKN15_061497 [Acipenser sinensis]